MGQSVTVTFNFNLSPSSSILSVGDLWLFTGDSHTAGRAVGTAKSPQLAFHYIWVHTFPTSASGLKNGAASTAPSEPSNNGVSGRRLLGTSAWYYTSVSATNPYRSWIHFQESGDQVPADPSEGQATSAQFGNTWEGFVRTIKANSTSAIISTETAFNFGRGPENEDDEGRDWTLYNVVMREKIASLSAEGITVYLSETDRNIRALDTLMGWSYTTTSAWYVEGHPQAYHFTEIGNLLIALTHYDMLGYDVNSLNLIGISGVSQEHKEACLTVINSFG